MTARLAGLFLPVTTPFDGGGAPAPDRLGAQIETYTAFPLSGIVLFGTSGEGPMLEEEERGPLLAAARDATPRSWALIVQIGRESAPAACRAAERAARAGADALLALPPRFYPVGERGLAAYYRAVRAATDLPLLAYHIPQRTHVDLPAALLVELAVDGTLAGIKDSAGDVALQAELKRAAPPGFAVLDGKSGVLVECLEAGADGAILAVAVAAPEAALAVLDAHRAGDLAGARAAAERLGPLGAAFGPRFGVPGIKAALDLRGWPGGGAPRAPLAPLGDAERAEIADALRACGVTLS